jgi:hypothetical protein
MKIHGICIVKDEVDIVADTLTAALNWCDALYIYDNGSTDGTSEVMSSLARSFPGRAQLYPYSTNALFTNKLRGEVFSYYKHRSTHGDWWCRLDADEFYIDDPAQFLRTVPDNFEQVWGSSYQFCFTDKDLAIYNQDPTRYNSIPLEYRIRYYKNNWSELRFVKHVKHTVWDRHADWPYKMGDIYPTRIRLKHFQHRSPEQIIKRYLIRRPAFHLGIFAHEDTPCSSKNESAKNQNGAMGHTRDSLGDFDWKSRVAKASELNYDNHDGHYIANENLLPPLKYSRVRRYLHPYIIKYLILIRGYLNRLKQH